MALWCGLLRVEKIFCVEKMSKKFSTRRKNFRHVEKIIDAEKFLAVIRQSKRSFALNVIY